MTMNEAIKRFLSEDSFVPTNRTERLLNDAYKEAVEADRLFDFLKWMTDQTDGRAVARKDENAGKVSIAQTLVERWTLNNDAD